MPIITLVSKPQARVGLSFRVFNIPDECPRCRLYQVCMGRLRPGRVYRIIEVKPLKYPNPHRCLLTGDEMVPVSVEEEAMILPVRLPYVVEGMVTAFDKSWCICGGCPSSEGLPAKIKVLKVIRREDCGGGYYFVVEAKAVE